MHFWLFKGVHFIGQPSYLFQYLFINLNVSTYVSVRSMVEGRGTTELGLHTEWIPSFHMTPLPHTSHPVSRSSRHDKMYTEIPLNYCRQK